MYLTTRKEGLVLLFLVPNGDLSSILNFNVQALVNLLIQWLMTAGTILIVSKLAYKPIKEMLRKRRDRVISDLDNAEMRLKEANAMKNDYQARLLEIGKERGEILEEARKKAAEREREIIADARKEAGIIMARAKNEIELEREKVKDEIKTQLVELSSMMAERYVMVKIDPETQNKLLEDAIADLGDATWLK